jgi:hypothetical protein
LTDVVGGWSTEGELANQAELAAPRRTQTLRDRVASVSNGDLLAILAIVVGMGLRVWGGIIVVGDLGDVSSYWGHVMEVRRGLNVYQTDGQYPYFPGWLGIELATAALADFMKWPFWRTIRSLIILADIAVAIAIWWSASALAGKTAGRVAAAVYALNPITIMISGFHGQFDALPTLCSVIAARLLVIRPHALSAGLLLGVGMALKPFPLLLLPIFVRIPGLSWSQRLQVAVLPFVSLTLISTPLLIWDAGALIKDITSYAGLYDQGLGGLLRGLWLMRAHNLYLPGSYGAELQALTRWLAIGLMIFTLLVTSRLSIPRQAAAMYLAFLVTYGGISTQYLMWPVAWLALSELPAWLVMGYGTGTTAGAAGFFSVFWPRMIGLPNQLIDAGNARYFLTGQIISYLTLIGTFVVVMWRGFTDRVVHWKVLILAGTLVVAIAVPVVNKLIWFGQEWVKFRLGA